MGKILDIRAESLRVMAFETRREMGKEAAIDAAKRLRKIIKKKGFANAVFAAAPSQDEFLQSLICEDVDWNKVNAFHMDEYIGLDKDAPQGFGNFLKAAIFEKVNFASINYLNGNAKDPNEECSRYSKLLEKNPPDIVFLGIGENGHLAFNDPGTADFNDPLKVKVVDLDDICRKQQVNDGCFKKLDDVPKTALTLTISMLMSIQEAIVIVPGILKKEAVANTVRADISTSCPATILRKHSNAVLYLDSSSAGGLI